MAFLVLFSTVSFTIEKHFCGDFLVDISYFGTATGCGDEVDAKTCDKPSVIAKKNCCKDEIEKIQGQDDLQQASYKKLVLEKQPFILAFIASYKSLFCTFQQSIVSHKHYTSPYFNKNIQVLHQVFII